MNRVKIKKHKVGRPSGYYPYYCDLLYKTLKAGHSVSYFCATAMIPRRTFYYWVCHYKYFNYAFELGKSACIAYWDDLLHLAVFGKVKLNLRICAYRMRQLRRWKDDGDFIQT